MPMSRNTELNRQCRPLGKGNECFGQLCRDCLVTRQRRSHGAGDVDMVRVDDRDQRSFRIVSSRTATTTPNFRTIM